MPDAIYIWSHLKSITFGDIFMLYSLTKVLYSRENKETDHVSIVRY